MNMTTQETESDAGLASELRISVTRLARRLRAERAADGLPVLSELADTQMGALGTLVAHGAMTTGALGEPEKVQPPSMTRVIAVLEQHGLVARAAHATGKRQVVLTVTDTGRELVYQSRRGRGGWVAQGLGGLTPARRGQL